MTTIENRLEECERRNRELLRLFDALQPRIRALEKAQTSVDCERVHRDMAEDERKDRWYATRDAVIASIANGQWTGGGALNALRIVSQATLVADQAHGPLEIVVPSGTKFDEAVLAQGGEFVQK